jgi:hypothetical protein
MLAGKLYHRFSSDSISCLIFPHRSSRQKAASSISSPHRYISSTATKYSLATLHLARTDITNGAEDRAHTFFPQSGETLKRNRAFPGLPTWMMI